MRGVREELQHSYFFFERYRVKSRNEKNIKVIVVSKGIDAVDFAILNNIENI